MKIAIPVEADMSVSLHFGGAPRFQVFETDGKNIVSESMQVRHGDAHGPFAFLTSGDRLLCGGMGEGAARRLESDGIGVVVAADPSGSPRSLAESFLRGDLAVGKIHKCCGGKHGH